MGGPWSAPGECSPTSRAATATILPCRSILTFGAGATTGVYEIGLELLGFADLDGPVEVLDTAVVEVLPPHLTAGWVSATRYVEQGTYAELATRVFNPTEVIGDGGVVPNEEATGRQLRLTIDPLAATGFTASTGATLYSQAQAYELTLSGDSLVGTLPIPALVPGEATEIPAFLMINSGAPLGWYDLTVEVIDGDAAADTTEVYVAEAPTYGEMPTDPGNGDGEDEGDGEVPPPTDPPVTDPMLLTYTGELDSRVAAELDRVLTPGATVFLLGGTSALSDTVEAAVLQMGYDVVRYGGADRYATSVAVAEGLGNPTTVFLTTGHSFADGLAAGTAAATVDGAVLLTDGDAMAAPVVAHLAAHPAQVRYAVGGPAARVDTGAEAIAGADRFATAAMVAGRFFPTPAFVGMASGETFPDALSGGVASAMHGGPLMLSASSALSTATAGYLTGHAATIEEVQFYGGPAALSQAIRDAVAVSLG